MTQDDRNRAEARFNKAAHSANEAKSNKNERDAALKAVTDNMAKLKALRLAREAAQPAPSAPTRKKASAKTKKSDAKTPALGDWLAGRQSGGHRT
jgi:hypothetical protein